MAVVCLLPSGNITPLPVPKSFRFPTTVSRSPGVVVPIPTLVSAVAPLTPLMLPRTRLSLWATSARYPMAVALVIPAAPWDTAPTKLLLSSVVLLTPAKYPTKELLSPVVLLEPASCPMKEFWMPVVLDRPA
jgi:hypothetical protein